MPEAGAATLAPLVAACLWALAAAGVALLPMRRQIFPGLALLLAAPALVAWLWVAYGPLVALVAVAAVLSMFRRPLLALAARALPGDAGSPRSGDDAP